MGEQQCAFFARDVSAPVLCTRCELNPHCVWICSGLQADLYRRFQGIRACYINLHAALKERVNLISRATDAHAHGPSSRANKEESAAEARREMEWL